MILLPVDVTKHEKELLQTIKDVKFGEMFGVFLPFSTKDKQHKASENDLSLLELLREGLEISVLTVHSGEAVMAEIDEKIGDFRCRKKIKLPIKPD
ncbi:MAG: hypothetical protein KQI81_08935 [Deltaproteobacteria bacterium]|nr:hypothetical protein [Deltaproteobacteria bacterium]